MRISYMFLLCSLILFVFIPGYAFTQSLSADIKSLTHGADVIVTGKVIEQNSVWSKAKTMILTQVTVRVDDFIKGSAGQTNITIIHPGGEIDNVGEYYSHIPVFKVNEEVLLFLKKDQGVNNFRVLEGESGKLKLYNDPNSGEKMTARHKKASDIKKEIRSYVQR
jgi:hypothetical protein